jgi:hypothetical protein
VEEKVSREKLLEAVEMCFDFFIVRGGDMNFFSNLKQSILPKLSHAKDRKIFDVIKEFEGFFGPIERKVYLEFVYDVRSATGLNLLDLTRDAEKKCRNIVDRGKIRNEKEWRLLRGFLEKLEVTNESNDLKLKTMILLDNYGGSDP